MADIRITNAEWDDDDLLLSCNMDGVPVQLIDRSWSARDFFELAGRGGAGAIILGAFFPAGLTLGAIIGAISKIYSMETGYYDEDKYMVRAGKIYKDDLF